MKNHSIGDILDVLIAADFEYELDSKKPRAIILITIPQCKLKKRTDSSQASSQLLTCYTRKVNFDNQEQDEEGFFFGMQIDSKQQKRSLLTRANIRDH